MVAMAWRTGSRGRQVGTSVVRPRERARSANLTWGTAVSCCPAAARSRAAVSMVGEVRPCSYADSVGREVRARMASSLCDRRASWRARISSSAVLISPPKTYLLRYSTGKGAEFPQRSAGLFCMRLSRPPHVDGGPSSWTPATKGSAVRPFAVPKADGLRHGNQSADEGKSAIPVTLTGHRTEAGQDAAGTWPDPLAR